MPEIFIDILTELVLLQRKMNAIVAYYFFFDMEQSPTERILTGKGLALILCLKA
jgi:hypothetical protein